MPQETTMPDETTGNYDLDKVFPPTPTDSPDYIIGGHETRDFPDCCAVGDNTRYFCSGTLIAKNVVVSARHCSDRGLNPTRVFLKGYDVSRPRTGVTIRIKQYFRHPTADLLVALLERDAPVTPRHVAQQFEVKGKAASLVGFGNTDNAGRQGYGKKRRVDGVPIAALRCQFASDRQEYGCFEWEMRAGHRGLNRDTCTGDSGGPLYILSPDTGEYYLLGATSRGYSLPGDRPCGDGGIYIRVDQFIPWIQEMTGVTIEGPRF
jgi:hypothetical protein